MSSTPHSPAAGAGASEAPKLSVNPQRERITSLVARGMRIDGTIQGPDGVLIRGEVRGDVLISETAPAGTGTVLVDESGVVRGVICAQRIVVAGNVTAPVIALRSLEIVGKGRIDADVYCVHLAGQRQGNINGHVHWLQPGENPLMQVQESRLG